MHWEPVGETSTNSIDIKPLKPGRYSVRVRTVGFGGYSRWVVSSQFSISSDPNPLPAPSNLDTTIGSGSFTGTICEITWDAVDEIAITDNVTVWNSGTTYDVGDYVEHDDRFYKSLNSNNIGNDPTTATNWWIISTAKSSKLQDYVVRVYNQGGQLGEEIRTEYVKDTRYVYTLEKNIDDHSGTPARYVDFRVWSRDVYGQESESSAFLAASNPAPTMAGTTPTVIDIFKGLKIDWSNITPVDTDLAYYEVYCDQNASPTTVVAEVAKNTTFWIEVELEVEVTYYVKIVPYDEFGVGVASNITDGEPVKLQIIDIDAELSGNILMSDSDSNTATTLAKLYDRNTTSDGVAYTLSGVDKYIQYAYPIEDIIDRVAIWMADANAHVYVAYSSDGSSWSYLKAEADHTLTTEGELEAASNQADAQTNYWQLASGKQVAVFPNGIAARYMRLYFTGTYSTTVYELIFERQVLAEQVLADTLAAFTANLGVISSGLLQSQTLDTDDGILFDLDSEYMKMGGTSVDYAGSAAGIFLGLHSTDYKVYIGDGSTQYFKYDAVNGIQLAGTMTITASGSSLPWSAVTDDDGYKPENDADVSPPLPSDDGLVGYWSLDQTTGTEAIDNSGNGHDGAVGVDLTWVDGIAGKAVHNANNATSPDNFINVPTHADLNMGTGDFSVSYWVNFAGTTEQQRWLIGKGTPYLAAGPGWAVENWLTSDPVHQNLYLSDGTGSAVFGTGSVLNRGSWYHLVWVIDRTSDEGYCYLNGVATASSPYDISSVTGSVDNSSPLMLLSAMDANNYNYASLDEVRFYSKALTASEAKALYLYPSGSESAITYWESVTGNNKADDGADVTADQFSETLANIDAATGKANLGLDSSGNAIKSVLPTQTIGTPGSSGLYLGSDFLGYYSTTDVAWMTYMANNGDFYLGGSTGALQWDASEDALTILGNVTVTGGSYHSLFSRVQNGDFAQDTDGETDPVAWGVTSNGTPTQKKVWASTSTYWPPWQPSAKVFLSECDDASEWIRLQSTNFIPVNINKPYTLGLWAREYSGTSKIYAGVLCYDSTQTLCSPTSSFMIALNGVEISTTWTEYSGTIHPYTDTGETFYFPSDCAYVKVDLYPQYGVVGGTLLSRISLCEGYVATEWPVIDGGTIIAESITANAVGANEIITNAANIKSLIVDTAHIANLAVETIKIANNAATIPSSGTGSQVPAADGNTYNVATAAFTSTGASVHVIATMHITDINTASPPQMIFTIRRDTTDLLTHNFASGAYNNAQMVWASGVNDTPASGSRSYYARFYVSGDDVNAYATITVVELKK